MDIYEFVENNCKRCKNKNNIKDVCEIRKNIDGNLQCLNLQIEETTKLVKIDETGFKFEEVK